MPYAITGALAVGCYSVPRATKDVDLFISSGGRVRDLIKRVTEAGFRVPPKAAGILTSGGILTLELPGEEFRVDLIASGEMADIIARSRTLRLFGKEMKVISPEDLIAVKLAAWRLHDRPDAIRVLANQWDKLDVQQLRRAAEVWGVRAELEKLLKAVEKVKRGER